MKKKKGTNVYEKKITLGRDEYGTPVRKSITGRTIIELNQRIEDARQKWMQMHEFSDSVLFSTYARAWLESAKAVRSINTRAMYENIIEKHLIPEIGDLYLAEITLADLQGVVNGKAQMSNTCSKIKLTLKQIFEAAVGEGLAKDIKVKSLALPPKIKTEKRPLTKEETDAVFNAVFAPEQRFFVLVLYYMGLRREEALALKSCDIQGDCIKVSRTLIFDKNNPVIKPTAKSSAGLRTIPIPEAFSDFKEYAKGKDILFPMPSAPDKWMSLSSYTKFWSGIVRTLSAITPSAQSLTAHIFRHNYATLLYYSNISIKKAAQLMGHNSIHMIMEIYAHLDEEQERTSEKLNALFNAKTPRTSPGHSWK